jgi:hypothetical protein
MRIRGLLFVLIVAIITLSGCSKKSPEESGVKSEDIKPAAAHPSMPPAAAPSASGEELQFTAPSDWIKETPTSSNRKAQYKLPRAAGDAEDAELTVTHFPGGGGTPQANVDRWLGQFTKADGSPVADSAKIAKKTIGAIPVTLIDVSGTYAGSMMTMQQTSGAKPYFRMLAAIAETKNGPWFFKLTGPENTIKKHQPGFDAFIISIR